MKSFLDSAPGGAADSPPLAEISAGVLDGAVLRRLAGGTFWLTLGASVLLILLKVLAIFDIGTIWDDAYIVQRYAHNLLHEGRLSWNPGEAPTYGLTAPAFLLLVVPLQALTGGQWALSAALASATGGVLFLAGLALLLRRSAAPPWAASAGLVLTLFCLSTSPTPDHFAGGMDTTLALTWLTCVTLAALRFEADPTRRRALGLGGVAGLSFVFRPDLLLFAALFPVAMGLLAAERPTRTRSVCSLLVMGSVVGALLLAGWAYFGTALPLPAHAKRPGFYGSGFDSIYRGRALDGLLAFVASYWPLFLVVAADLAVNGRKLRRAPLDAALLAGVVVFVAYHLFATLPIMPMSQRFYQPLIVPLALLSARGIGRLGASLTSSGAPLVSPEGRSLSFAAVALGLVLFSDLAPALTTAGRAFSGAVVSGRAFSFNLDRAARSGPYSKAWYKVASLRSLPDGLTIAATEIGALGAVLPDKRIVDMAGLTEPDFALAPFDAETLLGVHAPDLIYMPHPDYRAMNAALLASPRMAEYEVYTKEVLGTAVFGLAIHTTSPHYARLHALVPHKQAPATPEVPVAGAVKGVLPRVR